MSADPKSPVIEWETKAVPSVFVGSSSSSTKEPWHSVLPLLVGSPTIYNVSFDERMPGAFTSRDFHEILIWKYTQPFDPLDQEQCMHDLRSIDRFLRLSTPNFGHDPPCPLIQCHRGWGEPFTGLSHKLILLFYWSSQEAQARFKSPLESSHHYEWKTDDDLYERLFLGPVNDMQQNGWITQDRQANLHLSLWHP